MREIEKAMVQAVNARKNWKCDNTEVRNETYKMSVYLYGHKIYEESIRGGKLRMFTLAGFNTSTTRSRLRALGIDVRQRSFEPIYYGKVISKFSWYNA